MNILPWLPLLTEKQHQEREALGIHPLSERQGAIRRLRENNRLYRAASTWRARRSRTFDHDRYAAIADIFEGPRYTPPADQPD
jgi:hypothetical protein